MSSCRKGACPAALERPKSIAILVSSFRSKAPVGYIIGTPSTTADITLFDVSMLWYPTGDSRVRPYVCFGLGFQHFNFRDHNYAVVNTTTFSLPIGIGVKWMYTPWIVLRLEASHNWAVGNDQLDMMHNGALTAGVEVRFGGTRPSYWPWNPNRKIW
jgi:hypothetical protein